jgi:large subunit ribosomal protein L31
MKPDIHPKYENLTITMTNGEKFVTKSTYGKPDLLLDVDFRNHPAWSGALTQLNSKANAVASFNKKFAGITFGSKK